MPQPRRTLRVRNEDGEKSIYVSIEPWGDRRALKPRADLVIHYRGGIEDVSHSATDTTITFAPGATLIEVSE